jgi:hypothetical protein
MQMDRVRDDEGEGFSAIAAAADPPIAPAGPPAELAGHVGTSLEADAVDKPSWVFAWLGRA